MKLTEVFEKLAWGVSTAVILYAGSQLRAITQSVSDLNTNVAVILEKVSNQQKQIDFLQQTKMDKH